MYKAVMLPSAKQDIKEAAIWDKVLYKREVKFQKT